MPRKSTSIAVGGVFAALCLVVMILTVFPLGTYALPALAGALLVPVVVELGFSTAITAYASVALLSCFIVPDREAAMLFVVLFGYYPILKEKLDRIPSRLLRAVVKQLLFNVTVVTGYYVVLRVIGIAQLVEEFGEAGKFGMLALLLLGNFYFFVYDIALSRFIALYIHRFRKRLHRG